MPIAVGKRTGLGTLPRGQRLKPLTIPLTVGENLAAAEAAVTQYDVRRTEAELAEANKNLDALHKQARELEDEININRYTIQAVKEEAKTKKKGRKSGRIGGVKKRGKGRKAGRETLAAVDAIAKPVVDQDVIVFSEIADKYPDLSLALLLEAEDFFRRMDKDGSGDISVNELELLFSEKGVWMDRAELSMLVAIFDTDQNGQIDYMEYIDMLMTFTDDILIKLKVERLSDEKGALLQKAVALYKRDTRGKDQACSIQ